LSFQVQQSIDKIWTKLGDKPLVVDNLMKLLNVIYMDDLKKLGVNERTALIMDATRVLTKKQLVHNDKTLCNEILKGGQLFRNTFIYVIQKGIP
jgi:high-affinity K+ transport system ATPase subunit B